MAGEDCTVPQTRTTYGSHGPLGREHKEASLRARPHTLQLLPRSSSLKARFTLAAVCPADIVNVIGGARRGAGGRSGRRNEDSRAETRRVDVCHDDDRGCKKSFCERRRRVLQVRLTSGDAAARSGH